MIKFIIAGILAFAFLLGPQTSQIAGAAAEWYDPLPGVPGKFMGPHGPQHLDWHYHGPPSNEDQHCLAAAAAEAAPQGVLDHCSGEMQH